MLGLALSCLLGGSAAIAYGLWMAHLRREAPQRLLRLAPFRAQFGRRAGELLHGLTHTSLPIGTGMWLFYEGARVLLV